MRQVVEAIRERVSVEQARERVYLEWQTRALASFIAQTVDSPKAAKKLLEAAGHLSLNPDPDAKRSPSPVRPEPVTDVEVVRPGEPPDESTVASGARLGSFERLAAGMGGVR